MTAMSDDVLMVPRDQCYDCMGCGRCCSGVLTVHVTADEAARMAAQGWDDVPAPTVRDGDKLRMAHRDDGRCAMLDADNRCRIHAKFGEAAKPLACRLYPFLPVPAAGQVGLDLRYGCPAVAENHGRALEAHRPALRALLPHLHLAQPDPPVQLPGQKPMTWPVVQRVTRAFLDMLADTLLSPRERIAACIGLADAFRPLYLTALAPDSLEKVLATFARTAAAEATAAVRVRPTGVVRAAFRQLVALYGQEQRHGARRALTARWGAYLGMITGVGRVPALRPDTPVVPFAALETEAPWPAEAYEPLLRCLRVRLESLGFFGERFYGAAYLDGLLALLLTAPLTAWFARLYAAGAGLPAPDAACTARAVAVVHESHGLSPAFTLPAQRERVALLTQRAPLAGLWRWYG
jgi:lysine-N-methylase